MTCLSFAATLAFNSISLGSNFDWHQGWHIVMKGCKEAQGIFEISGNSIDSSIRTIFMMMSCPDGIASTSGRTVTIDIWIIVHKLIG